jgi:hypothetical protein
MWRNGKCKERGGQCKEKGKCDDRGELKSYIQFLCSYVQLICTVPNIQLFQLGPVHYTVHNHTSQAYSSYEQLICTVPNIQLF